jgi:hypothetical protein
MFLFFIGNAKEDMRSEDDDEEAEEGSSHIWQKKRQKSAIEKMKSPLKIALPLAMNSSQPPAGAYGSPWQWMQPPWLQSQ